MAFCFLWGWVYFTLWVTELGYITSPNHYASWLFSHQNNKRNKNGDLQTMLHISKKLTFRKGWLNCEIIVFQNRYNFFNWGTFHFLKTSPNTDDIVVAVVMIITDTWVWFLGEENTINLFSSLYTHVEVPPLRLQMCGICHLNLISEIVKMSFHFMFTLKKKKLTNGRDQYFSPGRGLVLLTCGAGQSGKTQWNQHPWLLLTKCLEHPSPQH